MLAKSHSHVTTPSGEAPSTIQGIQATLSALMGTIDAESVALFHRIFEGQDLKDVEQALKTGRPDIFDILFNYPVRRVTNGLVQAFLGRNRDLAFLYEKADFVEMHLKRRFDLIEGMPCCADKSRTILRALARHFADEAGRPIQFNYAQEVTYHLPQKILRTHDEIIAFFDALKGLYYGRFEPYVALCAAQEEDPKEDPKETPRPAAM